MEADIITEGLAEEFFSMRRDGREILGSPHDSIDSHGLGYVLQSPFAEFLKIALEPPAETVDCLREVYATRFSQALEPSRDIHSVTIQIGAFDDDVAQIDANTEDDSPVVGGLSIRPRFSLARPYCPM
jgi:hypothetical protein